MPRRGRPSALGNEKLSALEAAAAAADPDGTMEGMLKTEL